MSWNAGSTRARTLWGQIEALVNAGTPHYNAAVQSERVQTVARAKKLVFLWYGVVRRLAYMFHRQLGVVGVPFWTHVQRNSTLSKRTRDSSRIIARASKATVYPPAYVAAKLSLGTKLGGSVDDATHDY